MKIIYASAAPRVSLRADTELPGARVDVLGVIGALERAGHDLDRWIVGDEHHQGAGGQGVESRLSNSRALRVAADLARVGMDLSNRRRLGQVIDEVSPDLVYERHATLQAVGRAALSRDVPWVLEINGAMWTESSGDRRSIELVRLVKRSQRRAIQAADLTVTVSDRLKAVLVDELGSDPEGIFVMPNGVDTEVFRPDVPARRLFPDSTFVIGFVGVVFAWQGLRELIEAVAALRRQGSDVAATIVGDGPTMDSVRQRATELGIDDRVAFTGFVPREEIPALLTGFDCGYAGHQELSVGTMYHSPLKLYEYLAAGLPVVASPFPQAESLVGGQGLGATFSTPDELAGVISDLMARPDLSSVRDRARHVVVEQCSWDARISALTADLRQRHLLP